MKKKIISTLAATAIIAAALPAMPALAQGGTQPIQIGKLVTFEHDSGWFSIDMPTNWESNDSTKKGEEAIVTFTDPSGNAAVVVDVFPFDKETTQEAMGTFLATFINDKFESYAKFSASEPKNFRTNGASVGFSYDQKVGKQTFTMYGDSFIELHDGKMMSIMTVLLPKDQYDKVSKKVLGLLDTLQVNTSAVSATAAETFSDLEKYSHKSKLFTISVPAGWAVKDNSKAGKVSVVFSNPDGYSFVMVEGFKNSKGKLDKKTLLSTLDSYVDDAIGTNVDNFQGNDAEASSATSASKSFNFTIKDGDRETAMTGIVYLDQVDNALVFLRVALPTESIDANKDALDEIGNSFKINGKASF
jgi:hypothetical protein